MGSLLIQRVLEASAEISLTKAEIFCSILFCISVCMTKLMALFAWDFSWEGAVDRSHDLLCLPSFPGICGPHSWLSFCWADSLPSLRLKAMLLWAFWPLKPFTELTQLPMVSSYAFFMRIYLDFLLLYKALSKQSREHVSSEIACAGVGHFTPMGPAVPLCVVWLLSIVELLQACSSFSLDWSKHSQCLLVACLLALLQNCLKSGQGSAFRLALSAFGRCWHRGR